VRNAAPIYDDGGDGLPSGRSLDYTPQLRTDNPLQKLAQRIGRDDHGPG
jgi:hypothetical protein